MDFMRGDLLKVRTGVWEGKTHTALHTACYGKHTAHTAPTQTFSDTAVNTGV